MIRNVEWQALNESARDRLLARPDMEAPETLRVQVGEIIEAVRQGGDRALARMARRFDGREPEFLEVPDGELEAAWKSLSADLRRALDQAIETVTAFHSAGRPRDYQVETAPGVVCETRWQALEPVGLYVPAGTAPLPSTAIMLGVPAGLAGCSEIVLATPPGNSGRGDPAVLGVAFRLGISRVILSGGAQAIAAMAWGTETVPRCARIFGPGNRFVTEAKRQAAEHPTGASMDLPAGPSEVMVLADAGADPDFVALDLLSQAEHGPDSQVFLVTDSVDLAGRVDGRLEARLAELPRAETATRALSSGACILVDGMEEALAVANRYAPEHLIIATDEPRELAGGVTAAGSVFLGHFTPESLGDYVSGTNHVLPTGGWARSLSGVSVADFMRRMSLQEASPEGLAGLGPAAETLAAHEGLDAHRLAVQARRRRLGDAGSE